MLIPTKKIDSILVDLESNKSNLSIYYGQQQAQTVNTKQQQNKNNSQNFDAETPTIIPKFTPPSPYPLNGPFVGDDLGLSHKKLPFQYLIWDTNNKQNTICMRLPNLQIATKYTQSDNFTVAKNHKNIQLIENKIYDTNTPTTTHPTRTNHIYVHLIKTDHYSEQQQ